MKKVAGLFMIFVFALYSFAGPAWADEIADIKKQLADMQKVIDSQAGEIKELQQKLTAVEAKAASQGPAPAASAVPVAAAPAGDVETRLATLEKKNSKPNSLEAYWKDGLWFATPDKKFELHIGGRYLQDFDWAHQDGGIAQKVGDLKDQALAKSIRLEFDGTAYETMFYMLHVEFAGGTATLKDAYIGMKDIPYIGTVRAGHMKEPFSLDTLMSDKYLSFMERGIPAMFAPAYNLGVEISNRWFEERLTWTAGAFRDTDNYGTVASNEWSATTRVTGLPYYEEEGKKLVHLGMSYSFRAPEQTVRYQSKPEANMAPYYIDTNNIAASYANLLGYEAALVYGPLSLQGEFMQAFVDQTGGPSDVYLQGCYGQISYFITGENRPYKKPNGLFVRVIPRNNLSIKNGTWGAWEVTARYSYGDLNDRAVNGGIMSDATIGINWYLNPNMRLMGNYVHSNLNGVGDSDMILARIQVDF